MHYLTSKGLSIAALAAALCLTTTSCSKRLVGTWNVQRFETVTPGQQAVSLQNIGTVHFKGNGTGEKNLSFTALGKTQEDKTPFKWAWQEDKYVSISSEGSEFGKTWIIIENKSKFQKWKSTDGANNIQVIELKK